MRKEEFETESGQPKWQKSPHPQAAKDHMILGFDGECRKPEALGSEILNMLQVKTISPLSFAAYLGRFCI